MNILLQYTTPLSAIFTYRLLTPQEAIAKKFDDWTLARDDLKIRTLDPNERYRLMGMADAIHTHVAPGSQIYPPDMVDKLVHGPPLLDENTGELKYPAAIIWDMDDLYWDISPFNPSFHFWGHRRPDGTEMEDGERIVVELEGGKQMTLWEDGQFLILGEESVLPDEKDRFVVAKNRERVAGIKRIMQTVPMVTTTTTRLKKAMEEFCGREVTVVPNLLNRKDYPTIDLSPPRDVRILWAGGASHWADLKGIVEPLSAVLKEHPEAKLVLFGQDYPGIYKGIAPEQVEFIPWMPLEAYQLKMSTLNHLIALCPLQDSRFNACKSAIKWYESSAIARPAATLAARVGPFEDEIVDGETGLLYTNGEEFAQKLRALIEDPSLRETLAIGAHEWVWRERDAAKWADSLKATFEEAVKRQGAITEETHRVVF